jgi:hypothetical protein
MGIWEWTSQNWFNLLSVAGIIGGLVFTAHSLRSDTKTRRVANLLAITANHREIWKVFLQDTELARVLDASANVTKQPVTEAERTFVAMMILHINSVYFATKDELVVTLEGWRRDIAQFLSLPIPREVWEKMEVLQNEDFAAFIESCRNWK